MLSATTFSWDLQGCALTGRAKGGGLQEIDAIKDYWFDWRNYNPDTSVYAYKQ